MKTTSLKSTSTSRRSDTDKPGSDRATLIALYLFAASLMLGLLYFISLILFISP